MDEQAFALLIEPHRRALHLHCYLVAAIVGFPDPWLFEQCGLPPELT